MLNYALLDKPIHCIADGILHLPRRPTECVLGLAALDRPLHSELWDQTLELGSR